MRHLINIYARKTVWLMLLCLMSLHIQAARLWDLKISDNGRFLCYTDGTPFFWLGDTGWLLPIALDRGSAKGYLSTAHQQGFNVVQVQTLCGVPSINAYGQMSNISKSNPWDFSNINKEGVYGYWDHMDYIISEAERQGIYIAMDCIWGGLVKAGLMDVEGAKAYGTFLANRYKDRPNIIWMIGGDIQGNIKPEVWETLAHSIKAIDHRHLMTYHPRGRYTSAKWWAKADWIDFHMYQSGHRAYGQRFRNKEYPIPDNTEEDCWMYVDSTWAYRSSPAGSAFSAEKPVKPVIDGEPSYEHIPIGLHFPDEPQWQASDVRRYAYWDVFAGCFGHTYGNNAIMQMHTPGHAGAYAPNPENWYDAQRDSGYVQMKYLKALILALPFFDRIPDQSVILDNGTKYNRLIATRGKDYLLVYDYTSRSISINLSAISGKKKNLWWMDCQTGDLTFIGEYADGKQTFTPKRQEGGLPVQDKVLIAIDASKDYISKEQKSILTPVNKGTKDLTE